MVVVRDSSWRPSRAGEMRQGVGTQGHDAKGTVEAKKERMNRLVMNYFVTEGHVDAAREFARKAVPRQK